MRALASLFVGLLLVLGAAPASAFCGFYVAGSDKGLFADASQVVLMRSGTRTVLSMQNDYRGPPEGFALVVPVPVVLQKENVKTLKKELFEKVDRLGSPRLVEYWEQDPCAPPPAEVDQGIGGIGGLAVGSGGGAKGGGGVTIEAQFTVGEYEIVILSAKDAAGLEAWLHEQKYAIPAGAEPYFRPYVQAGMKFFVAKVDPSKVKFEDGRAALSPLRFHYDSEAFSLPVRLGLINSSGDQDIIINILADDQRYEVANRPNATIPTNLDVSEGARDKFAEFYVALFDRTLEKNPNAVVTEYAWPVGNCDPCPGTSAWLSNADLQSLGVDVMPVPDAGPRARHRSSTYLLTRLHARYSKTSMGDDFVFKAAPAIVGGREHYATDGGLETGSTTWGAYTNTFQARYAIRHPWGGAIECKEPHRGRWGGPPHGVPPTAAPATKTAFAARGAIDLNAMLDGRSVAPFDPDAGSAAPSSGPVDAGAQDAGTAPADAPKKSSCGCEAVGAPAVGSFAGLVFGVAALVLRRRRR